MCIYEPEYDIMYMFHIGKPNPTQANINPLNDTKIAIENIVFLSPLLHILLAFFVLTYVSIGENSVDPDQTASHCLSKSY